MKDKYTIQYTIAEIEEILTTPGRTLVDDLRSQIIADGSNPEHYDCTAYDEDPILRIEAVYNARRAILQ